MTTLKWCIGFLLLAGSAAGEIKNKGWWRNTVFYQVYPRSFKDSNKDGIGDLQGIKDKLQHFKDSGIGAIWLSPIYASPMVDFGYDISDFREIDPVYGNMADLENLVKEAHKLEIKIIMDLVPNHTSDKHKWFEESVKGNESYKDYYMWKKGKTSNKEPPNNWISVFGGPAWTYNKIRDSWYFHQFEYRQPDLNYSNPKVQQEMKDVITFWLDKGIDGFRIDAVPHIYERDDFVDEPKSNVPGAKEGDYTYLDHIYTKDDPRTYKLIESWRKLLDDYANEHNLDEKIIMTEAYTSLENTTKFYNHGSNVPFNFNFIINVNKKSSAKDFKKVIDDWISHTPEGQSANWVMGNHDRSRTASRYPGRADQMTMLAMILPGIAVTYNGEEIAMEDKLDISWDDTQDPQACNTDPDRYQSSSRDPNRTPFQWDDSKNAGFSEAEKTWLPIHQNYKNLNLASQKKNLSSHYSLYQKLTKLRTESETLKVGKVQTEVLNNDKVLAVVRKHDNALENVILLINFSDDQSQSVNIKEFTSPDASKSIIYVSSSGSNIEWGSKSDSLDVKLPAKQSVVVYTSDGTSLIISFTIFIVTSQLTLFNLI